MEIFIFVIFRLRRHVYVRLDQPVYLLFVLRGLGAPGRVTFFFYKGYDFYDFMFEFLYIHPLLKRVCSKRKENSFTGPPPPSPTPPPPPSIPESVFNVQNNNRTFENKNKSFAYTNWAGPCRDCIYVKYSDC